MNISAGAWAIAVVAGSLAVGGMLTDSLGRADAADVAADNEPARPSYAWRRSDTTLALWRNGKLLWQYNHDKAEGKGKPYFHPLRAPDGTDLTALRPGDHPWHRAMWFSWKYINGVNYWEENRKTGRSAGETQITSWFVMPHPRKFSARIELSLSYHLPGEPAVLTEKRRIDVGAPDASGRYTIDWRTTFTAGEAEVALTRTPIPGEKGGAGHGGYAGLSIRMAKGTRPWRALDSEGREGKAIHGKSARWVTCYGPSAGVAVLDHPSNMRHPSPWYYNAPMPYFSPAVLFNETLTLPAGKSFSLRYRVIVHAGAGDAKAIEKQWQTFAALKE